MSKLKYQTLKQLVRAYAKGELDSETEKLQLDNDDTFVYTEGENGVKVFDGGVPWDLLVEALDLLGIPNEGV